MSIDISNSYLVWLLKLFKLSYKHPFELAVKQINNRMCVLLQTKNCFSLAESI